MKQRLLDDRPRAQRLFLAVEKALRAAGPSQTRASRTQISFRRRRAFAWVWTPDRWLSGKTAPLVLSIALSRRDRSKRWKQVVEPRKGRWMHHLELWRVRDVDAQVRGWLAEAWAEAD